MKLFFLSVLSSLALSLSAQSQAGVSVAKRLMSTGTNNSYLVELTDVNRDVAVTEWESFIKPYRGKTKYNRKTQEFVTVGATVPGMGSGLTNLYAKIVEEKTDPDVKTTIIVWYETPTGFAGELGETALMETGLQLTQRYAIQTSRAHAQNVLRIEQEALAQLQKDLKKLQDARESYQKEVQRAETLIVDRTEKLKVNSVDIENREREIKNQTRMVKQAETNLQKIR